MNDGVAVRESSIEGKGVFATEGFARGDPILAIDDSRVVTDDNPLRDDEDEKYLDRPRDQVILMQPPERYINHSCEPNSYARTIGDTRYLFAMRDIAQDQEVTYDYRMDSRSDETGECYCGTERCSGLVAWDFFALPRRRQLEYTPYLDCWFFEKYDDLLEETVLPEEEPKSNSRSAQRDRHQTGFPHSIRSGLSITLAPGINIVLGSCSISLTGSRNYSPVVSTTVLDTTRESVIRSSSNRMSLTDKYRGCS